MNWENTSDRYVAFFDIMGFKDFVFRNSHDLVLKKMEELSIVIHPIKSKFEEKTSKSIENEGILNALTRPIVFSDSIVFVSNTANEDDLSTILFNCSWFINKCVISNIPVKGAISKGRFTADFNNSLYFGQPLIDAYLLQESVIYYGCIIDNLVEREFITYNNAYQRACLTKYKTPFAKGRINHYNLNWLKGNDNLDNEVTEAFNHLNDFYYSVHGETRLYVDNTIEFMNHCKDIK
jgi:hypothetical protein